MFGFLKKLFRGFSGDRIVSIERLPEPVDMIDIEVDGDHLFGAEGVVSHNSGGGAGGKFAGNDIDMDNTAESAGIPATADFFTALFQMEGEREAGKINLKIIKNRLGGYVGTIIPFAIDYDSLKISDWNDGELIMPGDEQPDVEGLPDAATRRKIESDNRELQSAIDSL